MSLLDDLIDSGIKAQVHESIGKVELQAAKDRRVNFVADSIGHSLPKLLQSFDDLIFVPFIQLFRRHDRHCFLPFLQLQVFLKLLADREDFSHPFILSQSLQQVLREVAEAFCDVLNNFMCDGASNGGVFAEMLELFAGVPEFLQVLHVFQDFLRLVLVQRGHEQSVGVAACCRVLHGNFDCWLSELPTENP